LEGRRATKQTLVAEATPTKLYDNQVAEATSTQPSCLLVVEATSSQANRPPIHVVDLTAAGVRNGNCRRTSEKLGRPRSTDPQVKLTISFSSLGFGEEVEL